jgi:hypothetical protein
MFLSSQFEAPDLPLPLLKPAFCKENACTDCYGEGQGLHPVHMRQPHNQQQQQHSNAWYSQRMQQEQLSALKSTDPRAFTPQRSVQGDWSPFKPTGPATAARPLYSRLEMDGAHCAGLALEHKLMRGSAEQAALLSGGAAAGVPPLQDVVYVPVPVPMMPARGPAMDYSGVGALRSAEHPFSRHLIR